MLVGSFFTNFLKEPITYLFYTFLYFYKVLCFHGKEKPKSVTLHSEGHVYNRNFI